MGSSKSEKLCRSVQSFPGILHMVGLQYLGALEFPSALLNPFGLGEVRGRKDGKGNGSRMHYRDGGWDYLFIPVSSIALVWKGPPCEPH